VKKKSSELQRSCTGSQVPISGYSTIEKEKKEEERKEEEE
jgi:hypothetical protein